MEIKTGDSIKIKDNLGSELERLGFEPTTCKAMHKRFAGTEQKAFDVYVDEDNSRQTYVTVDMCCEIPIQCCEPVV